MAQNLLSLKARRNTAQNIAQIAKAMEMIAASKIKRAQNTVETHKPYAQKISELTSRLLSNVNRKTYKNVYLESNSSEKRLLILITPDRGLCGSLNTNIAKKFFEIEKENTLIVTLGKRGERIASRLGFEIVASFPMGTRLPDYSTTYQLLKIIEEYFTSGKVSSVDFLFPEFDSIFSQIPKVERLLPLIAPMEKEDMDTIFKFEPNIKTMLDALIPHLIEIRIFDTIVQSYTSEQAARMIAMQNAKNNARDVASYLTLLYNKSRQEKITNELLDISNSQTLSA